MSGLGLQDDSQSADGQLQLGLQLIQQSYNRRVEELTREVEHWKRVAQHHKQQEAQTREELGKSNQRGSELQRQLGEKNQEVAQLTEARNVALNQIATLKKHASQLQSFKKNISNMLQVPVSSFLSDFCLAGGLCAVCFARIALRVGTPSCRGEHAGPPQGVCTLGSQSLPAC